MYFDNYLLLLAVYHIFNDCQHFLKILTEKNTIDMTNHINSTIRNSLKDKCPFDCFIKKYGTNLTNKLHISKINKDEVYLNYNLLK